jgi:hypothetical protein
LRVQLGASGDGLLVQAMDVFGDLLGGQILQRPDRRFRRQVQSAGQARLGGVEFLPQSHQLVLQIQHFQLGAQHILLADLTDAKPSAGDFEQAPQQLAVCLVTRTACWTKYNS